MRFKYLFYLLLLPFFTGLVVSCGDDSESDPDPKLSLSTSSIDIDAEGTNNEAVSVSCNMDWRATSDQSWITLTNASGSGNGVLTVTISENTDSKKRSGNITVTAGNQTQFVKVSQEGAANLSISPSELVLSGEKGSTGMLTITTTESWTISGVPSWLKLSGLGGSGNTSINVETTEAYRSEKDRSATLTVTAGKKTATAKVVQSGLFDKDVTVSVDDDFSLSNGYFANFKFGKSVNGFVCEIYKASNYDSYMTEETAYNEVLEEEAYTVNPNEPDKNYVYWTINNNPNTEYVLCAVAYKNNGKEKEWGKMYTKRVKTKPTSNNFDATVGSITYNSSRWSYTFTKHQRCQHFYTLHSSNSYAEYYNSCADIYLAYLIKDKIKNDPSYEYILNDGSYYVSRTTSDYAFLVWAWGVSDTGEFANNLGRSYLNLSSNAKAAPAKSDKPQRFNVNKEEHERFMKGVKLVRYDMQN